MIRKMSLALTSDAYAADDCVGSKVTIENVYSIGHPKPILHQVLVADSDTACPALDIVIFDADPTGTTFDDSAAAAISDADLPKIIGTVNITTIEKFGDNCIGKATDIGLPVQPANPTADPDLYAMVVARGASGADFSDKTLYLMFSFID